MILKRKNTLTFILSILLIFTFSACNKQSLKPNSNSAELKVSEINNTELHNVIKQAFTTQDGYSDKISKHMSKQVFDKLNVYNPYASNNEYKKPFTINFNLKQNSLKDIGGTIYANMTYTVDVKDASHKEIGGSCDVPIKFTIKKVNNTWYIVNKEEPA